MLNTVPLAERQQQLGAPIFTSLAPLLFRHACYPVGFTNWAECTEDDEEAFNRWALLVRIKQVKLRECRIWGGGCSAGTLGSTACM